MKILFCLGNYPTYGGAERVSTVLANEFVERGHQVHFASFSQEHPELAVKELHPAILLHKLDYPVNQRYNIEKLHDLLENFSIDIIFNQVAQRGDYARLCKKAARGTKCKVVTLHHAVPDTNNRIQTVIAQIKHSSFLRRCFLHIKKTAIITVSRWSLKMTYKYSDKYVVLSPVFIPIAKSFLRIKEIGKMEAIANPITRSFEPVDLSSKINEIIFVGRFHYDQKRNYRIVEIFDILQKRYPEWSLTFVGDGPDRKDTELRINNLGLKKVTIEGFRDPCEYYKRAKILLLTSSTEGFPLVIGEAMAYGVIPVVLGSFMSVYDIIEDGEDGIIVPEPYEKNKFARYVESVMCLDDKEWREMSNKAIEKSHQFGLSSIASKWELLFSDLMNK